MYECTQHSKEKMIKNEIDDCTQHSKEKIIKNEIEDLFIKLLNDNIFPAFSHKVYPPCDPVQVLVFS